MSTLAVNKHLSIQFFPQKTRLFHFSMDMDGPNPSAKDIKLPIPAQNLISYIQLLSSSSK